MATLSPILKMYYKSCRLVLAVENKNKNMIIHECTGVSSVLYVKALVVLIVYSCRLKTKNIIIYERIIAVLTSKIKVL